MSETPLNLHLLAGQLDKLYTKALKSAQRHDVYLRERKVQNTFQTGWYQWAFDGDDSPHIFVDENHVEWTDTDSDGDSRSMRVPITVLEDTETPEQWAERTYTKYLEHLAWKAKIERERLARTVGSRRAQYEALKAEFEGNDETHGTTAG